MKEPATTDKMAVQFVNGNKTKAIELLMEAATTSMEVAYLAIKLSKAVAELTPDDTDSVQRFILALI